MSNLSVWASVRYSIIQQCVTFARTSSDLFVLQVWYCYWRYCRQAVLVIDFELLMVESIFCSPCSVFIVSLFLFLFIYNFSFYFIWLTSRSFSFIHYVRTCFDFCGQEWTSTFHNNIDVQTNISGKYSTFIHRFSKNLSTDTFRSHFSILVHFAKASQI